MFLKHVVELSKKSTICQLLNTTTNCWDLDWCLAWQIYSGNKTNNFKKLIKNSLERIVFIWLEFLVPVKTLTYNPNNKPKRKCVQTIFKMTDTNYYRNITETDLILFSLFLTFSSNSISSALIPHYRRNLFTVTKKNTRKRQKKLHKFFWSISFCFYLLITYFSRRSSYVLTLSPNKFYQLA